MYGLAWRHGLDADRLVLIGIGAWSGTTALTTFLLVAPAQLPAGLAVALIGALYFVYLLARSRA